MLLQGKVDEARQAVDRAIQLSRATSSPAVKIPASIHRVRVTVAGSRDVVPAINELRSLAAEAKKLGYYNLESEARLELGRLLLGSDASAGRTVLTTLASDARAHGFQLLAHHAEANLPSAGTLADLQKPHK